MRFVHTTIAGLYRRTPPPSGGGGNQTTTNENGDDDEGEKFDEFIDESETDETDSLPPGGKWDFDVCFREADWNQIAKSVVDVSGEKE